MSWQGPYPITFSPFSAGPLPGVLVDPDAGDMVTVQFNKAWQPYVTGAIKALCQPAAWDMSDQGTLDAQIERAQLLLSLFNNPGANSRPFWETPEEITDDALPVAPWYENLSDWIIEMFLATTFTPGAAIVYSETIPRLRLTIRTGNLGALFRVLIDDLEIWTGTSYAPVEGLIDNTLNVEAFATAHGLGGPPHTLKILKNDSDPAKKLEVVKGSIQPAMSDIQFRQSTHCGLEVSQDGGITWASIYDGAQCVTDGINAQVPSLIATGIQNAINNGQIAVPGGQPGATPSPNPGACQTYHVELAGNSQWHLPSPMRYGDTLVVSNLKGGWSDNGVAWFCPDGEVYVLGGCTSTGQRHDVGDPLAAAFHMSLIMQVGATWFVAPTLEFINTAGTDPVEVVFQANDGTLNDNTGSISFDVTVCSGMASGWTHTFYNAASKLGPPPTGDWSSSFGGSWDGDRWNASAQSVYWAAFIRANTNPATTRINFVTFEGHVTGANNDSGYEGALQFSDASKNQNINIPSGDFSVTRTVNVDTTYVIVGVVTYPAGQGPSWIDRIIINGQGIDPWA